MRFFLIFFICFTSLPGFAQEDDVDSIAKEVELDRAKQVETAKKIDGMNQKALGRIPNISEKLKKLGHESFTAVSMMDERVVQLAKEMLKDSPLPKMSENQVKNFILERSRGSFLEHTLLERPKLLNCLVELLRDERVLSSAIGLMLRRNDLKIYAGIWIGLMILSWLFKQIFFNKKWSRPKVFLLGMIINLIFTSISLTTFYNMFYDELSPGVSIIIKHWKKRNL
jgi:hypothetical protein